MNILDFPRLSAYSALIFAREHGYIVKSETDPEGEKHYTSFAAQLLALQAAIEAGTHRILIEEDGNPDISFDDTDETHDNLNSGKWVSVYIQLQKKIALFTADGKHHSDQWEQVDAIGEVIGPANDPYWQVCASDMFR